MKIFLAAKTFLLTGALLTANASAAIKCGDFLLRSKPDGWMYINGVKPESQKITFLKQTDDYDNVMLQWMVADPSTGQWYGMDYVVRNGKSILNVEVIRDRINERRIFGSYDCVKVK